VGAVLTEGVAVLAALLRSPRVTILTKGNTLMRNLFGLAVVAAVVFVTGCSAQESTDVSPSAGGGPLASDSAQVPLSENPGIEVFVAEDLSPEVGQVVLTTLEEASTEWGLYWPVEYWILGVDEAAGVKLVTEFCERREELGQWDFDDCMDREAGSEQYSMIEYQQLGAEALATGEYFSTAGWNGTPEWGIHRFASTQPWGLTGVGGIPGDEDVKTVLHEYWHAVQHSFISTTDREARDELMGPVWFVEGSAEYMAQHGHHTLSSEGRLPQVPKGDWPFAFESQMEGKLFGIDAESGECGSRNLISIETYEDPCSGLGYEMGAWAIAYLVDLTTTDVLLEELHPMVEKLGWKGAFENAAGMSLEEFDAEFMRFMERSDAERLQILKND
jgi:hypothetical protein